MSAAIAVTFIIGGVVGTVFGMVVLSLGVVAKRNVSDIPEVPLTSP